MTRHRAPYVLGVIASAAFICIVLVLFRARIEALSASRNAPEPPFFTHTSAKPIEAIGPWRYNVTAWLNGEPKPKFQDNLHAEMRYVTAWIAAGWTNDFMSYINMVYLGLLTGRIPILPPFAPSHLSRDAGFPPFGNIFDVPRLSKAIGLPLLEWRDVKQENSPERDELGCWSVWSLVGESGVPRDGIVPQHLNLDISYTTIPQDAERVVGMDSGYWLTFSSLAALSAPQRRQEAISQRPKQPGSLPPDAQLMCFDIVYFIGAIHHDEWWEDWGPAWRIVGRHTRWTLEVERLGQGYVRRALGLSDLGGFPPYISVHARRGDFTAACGHVSKDECFPPLSAFAQSVAQIRRSLLTQKGIDVAAGHVLVTSDESDPKWWDEVARLGWRRIDHLKEKTEEKLGKWFVPFIDAVVQASGMGFVGTDRSSMSLVARRRVEDWQSGIGHLLRIGGWNADT